MTAFERFDPFEQRISASLDDIAAPRRPDYLDDILQQTARTPQRPSWSTFGRWFPMDTVYPRTVRIRRSSLLPVAILVLVALLAALAAITVVGSLNRPAPPFGLARNGQIAFADHGSLFIADRPGSAARAILPGVATADAPMFSPDGRHLAFITGTGNQTILQVADADGSDVRQVFAGSIDNAVWAPDSTTLALVSERPGTSWLFFVHSDGAPMTSVNLGQDIVAIDSVAYRPPSGTQILVRALLPNQHVGILLVDLPTGKVTDLGLPSPLVFGTNRELSNPVWSLDGSHFTVNYTLADLTVPHDGYFRVHIIAADGSSDVELPGPADHAVQEAWAAYSPDGKWILVHRWTWLGNAANPEGWLAVAPADGSAPACDIGPRIAGGEESGLVFTWSPDATRVLMRTSNTTQTYSIDPVTGASELVPWTTTSLPDWQRLAP